MIHYTPLQWLLFFFTYSFLGWVWESCFVSFQERRWVNRGFLHGPFLPIYGFGAVAILISTLSVSSSLILTFLFGMAGASLLEYITGLAMDRIFHVRYWDYTDWPLNLDGYISLISSLCWGVFSLLLVRLLHPTVEELLALLPTNGAVLLCVVLLAAITVDLVFSMREALDLRMLTLRLSESRQHIAQLQRRLEIISTVRFDDFRKAQTQQTQALLQRLAEYRAWRRTQLEELSAKLNSAPLSKEDRQALFRQIREELQQMDGRTDAIYRRAVRQLRRNPGMHSLFHARTLGELRDVAGSRPRKPLFGRFAKKKEEKESAYTGKGT